MTDIAPERKIIQEEETRAQAATSESVFMRVGAGINFINTRQFDQKDFILNGPYNIIPTPQLGVDGPVTYPWNFQIIDVLVYAGDIVGTAGITEFDIKWKPEIGGTFQSIFSVTPKISPAAAPFDFTRIGKIATGFTAPVLLKSTFDPFDTLRLDILQAMSGPVNSAFIKVFMRPVNP